jgi:hypothetical protein
MTLWTPSHLSSVTLMGWYRTVDPAGVAAIGADITVVSGAVTTWLDRSPLNVTLTKSGSGTITYSGNALGFGIAGIVADGNSAFHSANGIAYPVNSVVGAFVIANVDSSTPAFQRLVSLIPTGASDVFTGVVPIVINPVDTTQQIAYIYNLNTSGKINATLGVPSLFEGYPISDTQAVIALNAGTPGTAEPVPALSFNQLGVLEAAQGGGGFLKAAVAEIVLVAGVLSSDEQAKLEGYIAWNNGQQALLPAGHPYKSRAPLLNTTWNDADCGFDITLSGNVISKTGGSWETARTTTSHATGRWYFEMVMSEPGGDIMAGIANASSSLGWYVGSDTNGASYYLQGADNFNAIGTPAPSGTPSARVGFDVDLDLKQSRYTVDGTTYSPWYPHPTMAAGPYFSSGSLDNNGSVAGYWSAATITYAIPSGATVWDGDTTGDGGGPGGGGDTGTGIGGAGMQGLVEIYLIEGV